MTKKRNSETPRGHNNATLFRIRYIYAVRSELLDFLLINLL